MPTSFETFINNELPLRVSTLDAPVSGDIPVFTGVGKLTEAKSTSELGLATTSYVDTAVTKVWKDQGDYNVSGGTAWPTSANTIGAVPIKAGFLWVVAGAAVDGTTLIGNKIVSNGDTIRALVDNATNAGADWGVNEANLGYTPENQSNKSADFSVKNHTKFPSTQAVDENYVSLSSQSLSAPQKAQVKSNIGLSDTDGLSEGATNKYFTEARAVASVLTGYVVATVNSTVSTTDSSLTAFGKLQKQITDAVANAVSLSALRYVVTTPAIVANAYLVTSADVNAYGNKILKLTNATTIAVTLPTPSYLTASIGDSFNIRQGGAGGITISGTVSGVNTTSVQHTTITLIAESPTSWMVVGV